MNIGDLDLVTANVRKLADKHVDSSLRQTPRLALWSLTWTINKQYLNDTISRCKT